MFRCPIILLFVTIAAIDLGGVRDIAVLPVQILEYSHDVPCDCNARDIFSKTIERDKRRMPFVISNCTDAIVTYKNLIECLDRYTVIYCFIVKVPEIA